MISRRFKRSAVPQEILKHLALNTGKGVDCTRPPTDVDTAEDMLNLVVNDDGSISPRKPIVQVSKYENTSFIKPLYSDGLCLALRTVDDSQCLQLLENGNALEFTLKYSDYLGMPHEYPNISKIPKEVLQFYETTTDLGVSVVNANTSSILGNLSIALDYFIRSIDPDAVPHADPMLYDGDVTSLDFKISRYFKIYKLENIWYFEVMTPEINVLNTAEGAPALNPNTTLDNPYAVRDVYDATAPGASGILAYGYSRKTDNGIVRASFPLQPTMREHTITKTVDGVFNSLETFKPIRAIPAISGGPDQTVISTRVESANTIVCPGLNVKTNVSIHIANMYGTAIRVRDIYVYEDGDVRLTYINGFKPKFNVSVETEPDEAYTVTDFKIHKVTIIFGKNTNVNSDTFSEYQRTNFIEPAATIPTTFELYPNNYGDVTSNSESFASDAQLNVENIQSDERASLDATLSSKSDPSGNLSNFVFMTDDIAYKIEFEFKVAYYTEKLKLPHTVKELTESTKTNAFRIVSAQPPHSPVVLKAFCRFPNADTSLVYASWTKSSDGVNWSDCMGVFANTVDVVDVEYRPDYEATIKDDSSNATTYVVRKFAKFTATLEQGPTYDIEDAYNKVLRPDILPIEDSGEATQYRFRVCLLKEIPSSDPLYTSHAGKYKVELEYSTALYNLRTEEHPEYSDYPYANTVLGRKLMHKKAIYSYGAEKFNNNIFVTDIDKLITPLYNIINTDAVEDTSVTSMFPWRDYLVSTTPQAVYLHTKTDTGYLSKTVSTTAGVTQRFSKCCKPTLNGIILISGSRIYTAYPNVYAGVDNYLSIVEISNPIQATLSDILGNPEYECFAFVTSSEYVAMAACKDLANPHTYCVRYNLSDRVWTVFKYPVALYDVDIRAFDDIRVLSSDGSSVREFTFDSETKHLTDISEYGDVVDDTLLPIEFELDTGQKTDSIAQTKQFVESKLVFATDDALEAFPMELTVAIDGDPHVIHKDINTDSPFWNSDDLETKGTLGTSFRLGNEGLGYSDKGVLRQLVVRYSGKGRSIRHILKGRTHSKFRLYETYVRYKTLNVKR